ncbi:MAG: stage III sporulation protein AE [Lachnospiraceae bacterium]|nr:stage III sporulation protein AE [Lachnospiraceae bacterium]
MKRIRLLVLVLMIIGSGLCKIQVQAAEDEFTDSFMGELGLDEIDDTLEELLEDKSFSFTEAVKQLVKGEIPLSAGAVGDLAKNALFSELEQHKDTAVHILILIIVAAVFTNFANVFEKSQVADVSFYMMYLLLFTMLMKAFYSMSSMTTDTLNHILTFMKLLIPSYFLAAAFASGSISGAGFYELTLILITVIQWVLKYLVLPAVNLFVLFSMLNYLTKEEYLSKMAELLKTFVEWTLKTLVAAAIGFQAVQSLILPAVDALKTTVMNKTAGAIPGVGNIFSGVTEVVLGSALLIKNAIGAAGLILLTLICLVPFVRLGICTLLYKVMAALIQPVTDKRMLGCVSSVGEGAALLMRILLMTGVLFFVSIAMATASIKGG